MNPINLWSRDKYTKMGIFWIGIIKSHFPCPLRRELT